ncbi:MAG: GtrA family protein [Patescibacteria group bacterium]
MFEKLKKIKNQISGFYFFRRYMIAKEFIKFCLIGLTNLFVDMSVYWLLTRFFHFYYLLAAIFSFVVAVTWSFYLNRHWTFRHQEKDLSRQYIKFFIANLISIFINLSLFYVLVDYWHFYDLLAKFLAAMIVAFLNFSLNKFWTFRKPANSQTTRTP